MTEGCPDDIRALGWAVAVHNDYRLNGEPHTFWLFTRGSLAVKGEGRTDAEALNQIRETISHGVLCIESEEPLMSGDEVAAKLSSASRREADRM